MQSVTRVAMATAGLMLAHLWAAKAVRSAVFLSAWDARNLPAMTFATAIAVVATVPLWSKLLERFEPRRVVPVGFLISAAAHVVEWRLSASTPWVAVLVYMHIAGLGALLLSGFWSLVSEIFDPQGARASYGRIAAAGTVGGLLGGVAVERMSTMAPADSALLLLAGLHVTAALGVASLGRTLPPSTRLAEASRPAFELNIFNASPHLKTIALLVSLSTASAFVAEYLFQAGGQAAYGTRAERQQFFARFYVAVGIATSLAQTLTGRLVHRFGLGRTISTLPGGLGLTSGIALVFRVFPMFVLMRGVESVLRGSLFRSAYELLFVPMDPDEKRRTKTFLDVTCDRAGDAVGALLVESILIVAATTGLQTFSEQILLAITIIMAVGGLWLSRRLDRLYLGVVERHLSKRAEEDPLVVPSETGWTLIAVRPTTLEPLQQPPDAPTKTSRTVVAAMPLKRDEDPRLRSLAELRSGDRHRVEAALARLTKPDRMQVAQVITLLAWDDMAQPARMVLEKHAGANIGLLIDALVDPDSDFAVRRRVPRILGTVGSPRAIEGLLWGLDDTRFEVRYQCARAIDRLLRTHEQLRVDPDTILRLVDRELSVSPQVWKGHRLIDGVERDDDPGGIEAAAGAAARNLEHVFRLLGAIWPRDAVHVALRGLQSTDAGLWGLAVEYLNSRLPEGTRMKLWALVERPVAASSSGEAPSRSGPPRSTTPPSGSR
ncbi:MAG TPA: Npt1/Npt2 family nucleotide transporter [Vicinamibacterales bacterium]|nr:Npt1/Npt2 family nucleotide transporter [Vicinamibacterales bacterium]